MIDMFKKEEKETEGAGAEKAADKNGEADDKETAAVKTNDYKSRMEKEITIHTMPEKSIPNFGNANKARKTGMVIIGGGVLFVIIASVLLNYYLFIAADKKASTAILEEEIAATEVKPGKENVPVVEQPEANKAEEESREAKLPSDLEAETATSTAEFSETESAEDLPIEPEAEATSTPIETAANNDTDGDGLSDNEEILLGSDIDKPDTDGDGYDDLAEVLNLYNPTGGGRLIDNLNIDEYENGTFNYSLFYPADWTRNNIGGDDSVMFRSPDNNFVQVVAQANMGGQSIADWYKAQFGDETVAAERKISIDGWEGIKSEDGLFFYLTGAAGNYIFVISYIPGPDNLLSYKNIFAMMVKSLEIGGQ